MKQVGQEMVANWVVL